MQEVFQAQALRKAIMEARVKGASIGFVATMGYLHAGHLKLVEAARSENDLVVLSIYVNPTQFGPAEDFDRYPRDLERDRALAAAAGVDILFLPDAAEMYPDGPKAQTVWVDPGSLAENLCGASRPGHFRGVATVVAKLFHLVAPDAAYFGQKDGQQAVIIQQVARQLSFPIVVRLVPTVREDDGLALSSRNVFLTPEERAQASVLSQALAAARQAMEAGERESESIERVLRATVASASLARLEYAALVDLSTLQPVSGIVTGDALLALAVYFGHTRLIDNMMVSIDGGQLTFT